jgi:catechol 2,3-dioxygenase-like lactoylglutathione lyase family enzyme
MNIVEFAFIVYPSTDLGRSRAFYEGILGLKTTSSLDIPDGFRAEYMRLARTPSLSGKNPF